MTDSENTQETPIEPCDFDTIIREETPQAARIANYMALKHPLAHILDVGCGPGIYVTAMRDIGLDAYGIDNDPRMPAAPWFQTVDLTKTPVNVGCNFDVAISLEVGEHLPETHAERYVLAIANTGAQTVYFSAARRGQGGHGHINCQPKAYWVERFHRAGFWLDPDATARWVAFMQSGYHMGWLTQNGLILRRA